MVHKSTCPCTSPCTCPCAHVCACPCTCCTYNTQRHMRSLSLRSPYRLTCFCSANAPGLPRPCSLYPCCPAHVVACRVPTLARSSHTPTLDHARSIHAQSTRSIQGSHSPCPTSLGSRSLGPRSFRLQSFAAAAAHAAARAAPARTASARAAPALAAPARPTWTCGYRGMDRRARQHAGQRMPARACVAEAAAHMNSANTAR